MIERGYDIDVTRPWPRGGGLGGDRGRGRARRFFRRWVTMFCGGGRRGPRVEVGGRHWVG